MNHTKRIYTWEDDRTSSLGVIVCGHYGDSIATYNELADLAKQDFSFLKDSEIKVGKVTDSTSVYVNHAIITFTLPVDTVKEGYKSQTCYNTNKAIGN